MPTSADLKALMAKDRVELEPVVYDLTEPPPKMRPGQRIHGNGARFVVKYKAKTALEAVIEVDQECTVKDIRIDHSLVNPNDANPKPDDHPWGVRLRYGAEKALVENVRVFSGPKGFASYGSQSIFRDIGGGCWYRGLVVDCAGHTLTIQNARFNEPDFVNGWSGQPNEDFEGAPILKWARANSIAFDFGRIDGLMACDLFAARHKIGLYSHGATSPYETALWSGYAGGDITRGGFECGQAIVIDHSVPVHRPDWDWCYDAVLNFSGFYFAPNNDRDIIHVKGGAPGKEPIVSFTSSVMAPIGNPDSPNPLIHLEAARATIIGLIYPNRGMDRMLVLQADRGTLSWVGGNIQGRKASQPGARIGKDVMGVMAGVGGIEGRVENNSTRFLIGSLGPSSIEGTSLPPVVPPVVPPVEPPVPPVEPPVPPTPPTSGNRYRVGPGLQYAELHQIPKLAAGDKVAISWRPTPYLGKLAVNVSDVEITGIPGPNGELPELNGANAVEVPWATYWSTQITKQGIITVTAGAGQPKVKNVLISGLRLTKARQSGAGFKSAAGPMVGWAAAAAGVALYKCENVTISACEIVDNDNGIFGKSYGYEEGDIKNVTVEWCNITGNGVPGSDRQHNSYLEGIGTIYQFNTYGPPVSGSSGCNLKDRSAGTIIRYNKFKGAARVIDIVDPEDGAATLTTAPEWGKTFLYGNVILNTDSATVVHFGFDGQAQYAQKDLYAYYNTFINVNDRDGGGRWRTFWFKMHGAQKAFLANNIFYSYAPNGVNFPGDVFMLVEEYGEGAQFTLKANWLDPWCKPWMSTGAPMTGWAEQFLGSGGNPGFVDVAAGNVMLKADSICHGKAAPIQTLGWPLGSNRVTNGFNISGAWPPRTDLTSLGAASK